MRSDTEDLNRGRWAWSTRPFQIGACEFRDVSNNERLTTTQVCIRRPEEPEDCAVAGRVRPRRGHQYMLIGLFRGRNCLRGVGEFHGLERQIFNEIPRDHAGKHKSKPADPKKN